MKLTVIATGFDSNSLKNKESRPGSFNKVEETIYKPNQFLADEVVKEKIETEKNKKKVKEDFKMPISKKSSESKDEDLDIPAFIRKKMM